MEIENKGFLGITAREYIFIYLEGNIMSAIETQNLTKKFQKNLYGLNDLNLRVKDGEIFGFLGPNGAGKTTTINILMDFIHPTSGNANVLGYDTQDNTKKIREKVGILPEEYGLYNRLSGLEHIEFAVKSQSSNDDPKEIIESIGLTIEEGERKVGGYSRGMRQRLALGMALVGEPDVLILDEPSTGLDPNGIRMMREIAREEANKGVTVFFSSHILGQVEAVCDRVGILKNGELIAVDTIEGLRESIGTGSILELEVDGKIEVEDILEVAGVSEVLFEDNKVKITCKDDSAKITAINKVQGKGVVIKNVISRESSLEELFSIYTEGEGI